MHPALQDLSHSSDNTLNACPRQFEIYKCSPKYEIEETNVDFAFGSALGAGIQTLLCEKSVEEAIWNASIHWQCDLFSEIKKNKKSFWYVVFAIRRFVPIAQGLLKEWRVAEFGGKAAIELSFRIRAADGFKYRGFVDVVLINRQTLELMVVELKTTGAAEINEASYRNSGQAIGYSIVLDVVAAQMNHLDLANAFKVMYLVYSSSSQEYQPLPFPKHRNHRARWIAQLILKFEKIKLYDKFGLFPMHGESCFKFYKPCPYLGICEMSNAGLGFVKEEDWKEEEKKFTLELTLDDIINAQLEAQT